MSGRIVLLGLGLTVLGIVVVAMAGAAKDAAQSPEEKAATVAEFNFRLGIMVAIFSGIMSACFAFGLAAGEPVKAIAAAHGAGALWTGLPILCMVMFGGLVTNAVWCAILMRRNGSAGQWLGRGEAWRAAGGQLPAVGLWRHAVVFPVLLLHHGREPDGQVRLFELGAPHGQHHHLRHRLGLCAERMEGRAHPHQGDRVGGISLLLIATVVIGLGNKMAG
jgi:L-rhamnose-H+ transport protein